MNKEYILSFNSTNQAIKAEHLLLAAGLNITVMPLPPQVRAGCGICLRINPMEIEQAEQIIHNKNVADTRLYERVKTDNKYVYYEITERDALWNND